MRSGYVLVAVVAISAVLAITGAGLLSLSLGTYRRALYSSQEIAARSAAEAGVAAAYFAMKSYDGVHLPSATNVSVPGCNASYSYTVSLGTSNGTFVVASTGSAGNATKAIHAYPDRPEFDLLRHSAQSGPTPSKRGPRWPRRPAVLILNC